MKQFILASRNTSCLIPGRNCQRKMRESQTISWNLLITPVKVWSVGGWQWWTFFTLEITGGCNLNPNKANENSDNK